MIDRGLWSHQILKKSQNIFMVNIDRMKLHVLINIREMFKVLSSIMKNPATTKAINSSMQC